MERHEPQKSEAESKEGQAGKQALPTSSSPASPSSSSPTHDFSFTVSLHHSSSTSIPDKSKPPPSFALDLSPADDIFFHGHLLPLHLLSHLSVSPRSSTTSMDSFTLPITDQNLIKDNSGSFSSSYNYKSSITMDDDNNNHHHHHESNYNRGSTKGGSKSKSFSSIFGLTRGRKGCQVTEKEGNKEKHKRKVRLHVVHVLKRYLRMVRPVAFFRRRRDQKIGFHGQPAYNSYSGNLSPRNKRDVVRGRRGEYSAPASMRTSPTNSGLLLASSTFAPASDSTMEELQAAIQAAIAHCKNSTSKEDKLKC